MVKKKMDASQQELFARQQKLNEGNKLRNRVTELQAQREALSKRKCMLEVEIQENSKELDRLDVQLVNTMEKTHELEEKIKTMPMTKEGSG